MKLDGIRIETRFDLKEWSSFVERGYELSCKTAGYLYAHSGTDVAPRTHGGRLRLPADFLIASDGRVVACKHGAHVDDHWSLDDVLAQAQAWREKCSRELACV